MQEDFKLRADFSPIELDSSGITLVAPGLQGTGTWHSRRETGETRAFTGERDALDDALAEAGLEDRHTLVIEAPTPPETASGGRAAGEVGDDEILLQVPAGANEATFVMYIDEAGIISFHYREPAAPEAALPSRAFGAARQDRFRIPLRSGASHAPGDSRALFSRLASKIVKVIVVEAFPDYVGAFVARRIKAWEERSRPILGLHGGKLVQFFDPAPPAFGDLASIAGKKSLLFIHGTTSSTAGAFSGLQKFPQLLERLDAAYEGRLIGFNHHTMSIGVAENVRQLFAAFAEAPAEYTFDIVCHSRGGLLARALMHLDDAGLTRLLGENFARPAGLHINIDRIVFVATPNAGTDLALPTRIAGLVERLTNYVNMLPDSAGTIAAGALMSLAAAIAEAGLPRIPGLADQAPESELLGTLRPSPGEADRFFAFQASFRGSGDLLQVLRDATVDRLFADQDNDVVVPTKGVSRSAAFELDADRVVQFAPGDGVHHTNFFSQSSIGRIASFLGVS